MARLVRRRLRTHAVGAILALALLVPRGAAAAQRADERYDALVHEYAHGNQQDAALALARWSRADVTSVAGRAARFTPDAQRAAVMIHTDAAITLLSASERSLAPCT